MIDVQNQSSYIKVVGLSVTDQLTQSTDLSNNFAAISNGSDIFD